MPIRLLGGHRMISTRLNVKALISACLLLTLSMASLPVMGCRDVSAQEDRKQQIDTELNALTGQSNELKGRIADQQSEFEAGRQRLTVQRAQLGEYNAAVQGYMAQHKMAVAVIAAGLAGASTQLSKDNEFSQDAKDLGGLVAVGAAIWVIANMDEVTDVFNTLNQADAHVKSLKAGIEETAATLDQRTEALHRAQQDLDAIAVRVASLKQQRDE
jgi:peptidoglycan hydrolase CwlO-like protein